MVLGAGVAFVQTPAASGASRSRAGGTGAGLGLFNLIRFGGTALGAACVALLGSRPHGLVAVFAVCAVFVAAGLAFAASLGEFGATSFLARPDRPTLPVLVYRLIGRPGVETYGMALAASVVLALVTALVVAGFERVPRAAGTVI